MFDEVKYFGIDNINGQKQIIFDKKGKKIPIDSLSSGEKQIIYRGAFLLKNLKSLNGCIVFIDEPEISMHPKWQQKILTYYKSMFRDTNGVQTSQMFVVTHSPFIIHNSSRQNDKVIVLSKNANDQIISMDKPEYYKCDSVELVEDAFNLKFFLDDRANKSIVYVEGRTDEKYLNKALEIYKYKDLPFEIKWCGYLDNKGQERNTGSSGLDKIKEACITLNLSYKTVLLYDCDTNKRYSEYNNVIAKSVKTYDNNYIKKGIENSLIITEKPGNTFYSSKTKVGDYNETITYQEFDKMKYCDYICSLSIEKLEIIFENLKAEIDELIALFK